MTLHFEKVKEIKNLCWGVEDEHYNNKNFIEHNEIYNKLKYLFIKKCVVEPNGTVGPGRRCSVDITLENIKSNKQLAFGNIRVNNSEIINNIELEIGGSSIDKIHNL